MASRKKRKSLGQLALNIGKYDERIPKLVGILMVFLGIYLLIAFTSYLFTWKIDQDSVLRFSWALLFQGDLEMANWLGRLGAIVSNMFFYWGFGLPSYIFVFLFFTLGFARIRKSSWRLYIGLIWNSFLLLLFSSILLEFIFQRSEFPWGGAFGDGVSGWLMNFVGTAGTVAFLLFALISFITWVFNPNYHEMTFKGVIYNIRSSIEDLISGRYFKKRQRPAKPALAPKALRPSRQFKDTSPTAEAEKSEETALAASDNAQASANAANETVNKGEQLSFELDQEKRKRQKQQTLRTGDSSLEIEQVKPTPSNPTAETPSLMNQPGLSIQAENQNHGEPYDPTLELSSYEHPVLALLKDYNEQKVEIDRAELEQNKDQIIETLLNYKIEITKIKATIGPTVTLYEIVPAAGVRISRIKNLEDDIALSLAALGIRIIAPIPGKGTIGIEVPNKNKQIVSLKEILMSDKFKRAKMDLPIGMGKTISNEVFVADLAKMPHLLIAGATGQGKSVGINVILMSLLYKKHPSQIKFVLIDPKKVELFPYSKIENHFLAYLPGLDEPIVTDTTKVVHTLNSLTIEMEARYNLLKKAQARNIREYNEKFVQRRLNPEKGHRFMPFIVLVIDEFADLIMTAGKEIELPIGRLAQLSRAVGIHLIIATQRPSVNIITGVIKANFPARIAFRVTAKVDSRTILDSGGADRLIGRGDMLLSYGSDLVRLQCAFVDTPEVENVIDYIAQQQGYPTPFFLPEFHGDDEEHGKTGVKISELDEMFPEAARLVVQNQHGSTSMIQRRLKLGYNRAGRIMDQLEGLGIVGPSEGSKAREVLMYDELELERYLEDIKTRK
ncbi:MAG: DNA translocase FtsK 4TM domain-containing protein [Bacteroidota bacterium]